MEPVSIDACQFCGCSPGPKKHLSDRDKLDSILLFAERRYNWSLKQFSSALFTAEKASASSRGHGPDTRVKKVVKELAKNTNATRIAVGILLVEQEATVLQEITLRLRDEQEQLHKQVPEFQAWRDESDPHSIINLANAVSLIGQHAPLLYGIISKLSENRFNKTQDKDHTISTFFIFAILNYKYARNTSRIQRLLGLYFKQNIGRRRLLGVLHHIGLTASWSTLSDMEDKMEQIAKAQLRETWRENPRSVAVWDNFEVYASVSAPHVGHTNKMYSLTTGVVFEGVNVPAGGLKHSMFDESVPLLPQTVQRLPGLDYAYQHKDINVHKAVSCAFIADALKATFPEQVNGIFSQSGAKYPSMPVLERIQPHKTTRSTLELMMDDEASVSGTLEIIENIFVKQLGHDPEIDFGDDEAFLVCGDQATLKNVLAVRNECARNREGYDTRRFLIPIPGLFHFRMHFAIAITDVFAGPEGSVDTSTLGLHQARLGRQRCPLSQAPHQHKEELIKDSGYARIAGFAIARLAERAGERASDNWVSYLRACDIIGRFNENDFHNLVEHLYEELLAPAVQRSAPDATGRPPLPSEVLKNKVDKVKPRAERQATKSRVPHIEQEQEIGNGDEEITNHRRYLFWTITYFALCYGIKWGDSGLIRWALHRSIPLFHARNKRNYAFVSCWLVRMLETAACNNTLQNTIIANSLVNTSGREDGFFETDRLNEILNRDMRDITEVKRVGTFDIERSLKKASLIADFQHGLRDAVEGQYGIYTNTLHGKADRPEDIYHLAYAIAVASARPKPKGWRKPFEFPDLIADGMKAFINGGCNRFNLKAVHRSGAFDRFNSVRVGLDEEDGDSADQPQVEEALRDLNLEVEEVPVRDIEYETQRGFGLFPANDGGYDPQMDEGYASQPTLDSQS